MKIKPRIIVINLLLVFAFYFLIDYVLVESRTRQKVKIKDDQVKNERNQWTRVRSDANCRGVFEMKREAIEQALKIRQTSKSLSDEIFHFEKEECPYYRETRGFDSISASQFELEFPLAFTIMTHDNAEQFERFLRSIYRSHNVYCVHVDAKSSMKFRRAIQSIVDCFDNVFLTNKQESVVYASFSRLKAELNCMRNIFESTLPSLKFEHKHLNPNWKYLINTASTEFPLRTNYEMTRILHMYNGTNEIEIIKKFNRRRIDVEWQVVTTKGGGGYVLKATNKTKSPPPHNFRIVKGSAYGMFSRAFVEYALTSSRVKDLLEWGKDTWSPDEWIWATLQFNTQFKPPGGFKDPKRDRVNTLSRFAGWGGEYKCKGKWRNGVCVLSVRDLPYLTTRPHFYANKFLLDSDPIAYECMEEWLEDKTRANFKHNQMVNLFYICQFISDHSTLADCDEKSMVS